MTIASYIDNSYAQLVSQLGWSTPHTTIAAKALQLYGVDTEAEATDATKLDALVDYAVWRQALADVSLDYSFSADGSTFNRSQMVEQVRKNLMAAETKALAYLPEYQIIIHEDDTNADWWDDNEDTEYP